MPNEKYVIWIKKKKINKGGKMEKSTTSSGIGFTGLLTIVFITLKLLKVISWS